MNLRLTITRNSNSNSVSYILTPLLSTNDSITFSLTISISFVAGYSKPRLECPKDVMAELPPGRDEAFVTFDQPSTDLDWFRYVRSKPSWGTRLEANLTPGVHEITFFARHPVSKKQASCVLRIIVKGD